VASQVIDKLARQINDLTRGLERPTKSPGKVAQLTEQVNSLQHELAQIRGEVAGVECYKVELVETSDRLGQVELKLGQAEALLEKNKRLKEIEEKIGKLEKDYDNIDERIRDIESLQKQF
jgi:chromosome segregation ATPase